MSKESPRSAEWHPHDHRRARRPAAGSRLRRAEGSRIGGVASGIAEFVGASARTVRLLWLLSIPLTGGLSVVAYLLLWLLLPGPTGDKGVDGRN